MFDRGLTPTKSASIFIFGIEKGDVPLEDDWVEITSPAGSPTVDSIGLAMAVGFCRGRREKLFLDLEGA